MSTSVFNPTNRVLAGGEFGCSWNRSAPNFQSAAPWPGKRIVIVRLFAVQWIWEANFMTSKIERLEARVSREQKQLFQRAADLEGRSLTDFMIQAIQDAAHQSIHRHGIV